MEQILYLRKETRLAVLCLMLDFYNTPQYRFYDRKLAYAFIKKCASKFEFSQDLENANYFDVNRAYDILKGEKNEVKDFFREVIKYQAYLMGNHSKTLFEPHNSAEIMSNKVKGINCYHPITSSLYFVMQDPFANNNGHGIQYIVKNIEDFNMNYVECRNLDNRERNDLNKEIFYKDL